MAVRREIERASQQPLDYGAKGKLLGVVVRKVRDALLKLCHEGIDFRFEYLLRRCLFR